LFLLIDEILAMVYPLQSPTTSFANPCNSYRYSSPSTGALPYYGDYRSLVASPLYSAPPRREERQTTPAYGGGLAYSNGLANQSVWQAYPEVGNQLYSASKNYFLERFPGMMQAAAPTATQAARMVARFFL
jgi:hypothetical protein